MPRVTNRPPDWDATPLPPATPARRWPASRRRWPFGAESPNCPMARRGTSEKTRWIEGHAALVEDRADALLATGRAAEIIGELEAAVADAPLRERRWGQLMLALYRAGRQGEALGAYQRARSLLADELGVDPGPDLRRLEAAIVAQDSALETPVAQQLSSVTRAVTFLLTDIEGSTAAWEADADAMAVALARHDELVEQVVTSRGGRLIKTRGEGDATFSVFERPSAAAAAAIELQDAIVHEPWALREPMRIRVALHTGEVELRDGDYFGRAVNRAARLRSLAAGGQILCSGATAELVIDSLPDDVVLADLGTRQLRNLARPEHVFELRLETADDVSQASASDAPMRAARPARGARRPRAVRRARPRARATVVRVADRTRRWHACSADRRRTWCRQDASGRRMVPTGLRARRRGALRPLRRGPRCAVPAVRGSPAFAGAVPRCQPASWAARRGSTTPTGSRADRCPTRPGRADPRRPGHRTLRTFRRRRRAVGQSPRRARPSS